MMVDYLSSSDISLVKIVCIYVTSMRLRVNRTLHVHYNVTFQKNTNDSSPLRLRTHVVLQTKERHIKKKVTHRLKDYRKKTGNMVFLSSLQALVCFSRISNFLAMLSIVLLNFVLSNFLRLSSL